MAFEMNEFWQIHVSWTTKETSGCVMEKAGVTRSTAASC